jgi:glucose/arabinose dehydrogenase
VPRRALLVLILAVTSLLPLPVAPAQAASAPQAISTGKVVPWGLAFLPDGSAVFTERNSGNIWTVTAGKPARHIYTVTESRHRGEGGLLGIAVAPDYARNPRFFVYYTTDTDNRVAVIQRYSKARPKPIVTGIPAGTNHNGGRLLFGLDGALYVGTGDAANTANAQNTKSLGGKVLRITTTGAPVHGNRYGRVFTYGHRNVQGLVMDGAHRLWATEFGQNTTDEVNLLTVGGNYGWPVVEGTSNDSGYINPKWTWSTDQASPSGITVKDNSLYVAALRGERVWRLTYSGTTISSQTAMFTGTYGRIRTVLGNPKDRSVWLMTSNQDGRGTPQAGDDKVLRFASFP